MKKAEKDITLDNGTVISKKRRCTMVAAICKVIMVFYVALTKGIGYDGLKMMSNIHRNSNVIVA